jgi:uncharacterized protein YkwD
MDGRRLLSGDISASLAQGVLAIEGTSESAPIKVEIVVARGRLGAPRRIVVDVEGVGRFPGSRVREIQIDAVAGQAVEVVNPLPRRKIPVTFSGLGDEILPGPSTAPATTLDVPATSSLGTSSLLEREIVDLTNQARAQQGLPALRVSDQLVSAAQTHSRDMARLNVLDHVLADAAQPTLSSRAEAVGYDFSWLGENIAFNYADAQAVVTGWMNSPGHRANILNANFTEIGVGVAWNGSGQPYFTQEFGRPS